MATKWSSKDPADIANYVFDWGIPGGRKPFLAQGVTISTATVTVTAGITKGTTTVTDAGKSVTVLLSGGTAGQSYNITCLITTSDGQTFEITNVLKVAERLIT